MTAGWDGFGPATSAWFDGAFAAPTPAQVGAWRSISAGRNALVVAPTGSGKTLAAFLWSLDRLASEPPPNEPLRRCRVLYVSPLKALAVDVERNLRAPLAGIRQAAARLGTPQPDITVAMRSGDTPADQRRAFNRTPPDILITTPESLFLLLTSAARESLRGVETVIVDEVHAVAASKRGAHLALSLERLDALLPRPAQRIGLSATVRPVQEVARFLGGSRPVDVVQPPAAKMFEVTVEVPVEDMTRLDEAAGADDDPRRTSIWPAVEERVLELIRAHRSTIVFANSRRGAERLCARLNELAAETPAAPVTRMPAEVMAQSGLATGAPVVVARAHHGSVSREERLHIEEQLKSGLLPAVVATSSLELGIDMGAVDLVVQIEAPPSVASGLQRIGRAGHQVGAASKGVVIPKHRGDLLSCAVVAQRMVSGAIEEMRYPRNPLDVLAQQIVAMVAMDDWPVGELTALVRRAAPFDHLPDSALGAVLDMLSGRYPSTAFAELRPRVLWDRTADVLSGRPGAQRLAVTSGGTIPDRGLFGVFLAHADRPVRVGELDEEMVYESRVGDVFLLGSSSWRIEDITPDRVLVSPAPGAPARMPFWKGDSLGRPVELGRAIGAGLRSLLRQDDAAATVDLRAAGLDAWAAANLMAYLREQAEATRAVPDDRTVVLERFRDELGDWRLVLHCVLGARVTGPWALAIGRRLSERYGVDAQVVASDDGIVIRLPDMVDEPPGADLVSFDPDEIVALVEESVGASALFASRFRECAARALLLPRRDPRRRQPLWQQRQRSAQLLDVARDFPEFPVTLEAARECLQDVYDVPGLAQVMRELASRKVRLVEVETPRPSPFARSMLFGYVGAFLYEGDAPLAERRAAALTLDAALLGELLGRVELRELLDPEVVTETERQLRWLTPERRPRDAEDVVELLRLLGDLSDAELAARGALPEWPVALEAARRAIRVRVAGQERWIGVEDAGRYRDALGVALPVGVAVAHTEPVADPVGDLLSRYARTHGPFTAEACAHRFGLGVSVVEHALRRLGATGRVVAGEFSPGGSGAEWCDAEVLRLLRRRSLAALRKEIEPVDPRALAVFLPQWQQVGSAARGVDGLAAVVEQLQGVPVPASALESLVLPARIADYSPTQLDELCASGEVVWAGAGSLAKADGWVTLAYADGAALLLPVPDEAAVSTPLHTAVLDVLDGGQALFFRALSDRVAATDDEELLATLWDLVWGGWLTNDTLAPLRALLGGGGAHKAKPAAPRSRYRRPGRPALPSRSGPPAAAGRWSRLPDRDLDPTRRAAALADTLLERHGVLTRGAVMAENAPGGFAGVYPVLAGLEERGAARRGYFVEGLGAAQFAVPGAVDRLRAQGPGGGALVLAATDPANPYGAALPWPERAVESGADEQPPTGGRAPTVPADGHTPTVSIHGHAPTVPVHPRPQTGPVHGHPAPAPVAGDPGPGRVPVGHRAGRKAGALVVLVDGALVLYVERGGRTLLSFDREPETVTAAASALGRIVSSGALGALSVERADGGAVHSSTLVAALTAAGFRATPRGLRLRA
ncbi:DEAD/DEAH box helicase [Longispora fulva]|uniref:ATP-dependent Lhr-like helicase n=1 Tax=Longispora fulva TaxID=619741 RepID=A0A8J7GEI9_9ACTN|nr:ATP-dependent helicase [Longispora fulva]MBG6135067.1 ATP-dependent Lhr-like helicase [Longispora fulva]GIG56698.1 DEAD/DEAH box helicase [Longispora fulva]